MGAETLNSIGSGFLVLQRCTLICMILCFYFKPGTPSKKNDDTEKVNDDDENDPIRRSIGHFGTWQLYITLALTLTRIPLSWHLLGIVFLAPNVDFNCTMAEGEVQPSEWEVPESPVMKWLADIARNSLSYSNNDIDQDEKCFKNGKPCVKWEYEKEVFTATIISEWDLVCKKKELADVAQLVFMLGVMIGNILFGMAADRWGRKKPTMLAIILQIVAGTGCSFVQDYISFLVLRFFDAIGTGGGMVVCYVLCMELLSKKWRTLISTLFHAPFFLGHGLLPIVSYFLRDWRDFQLGITLPFVFLLSFGWFVPESPRWLLAVGRKQEALEILQKIAKVNKMPRPEMETIDVVQVEKTPASQRSFIDIFKIPRMGIWTFGMFCQWFTSGICYFGLAQYMSKMEGDIFINVAIAGAVETPGAFIAVYSLEKFGRKLTLAFFSLLSGVFCLLIIAVPDGSDNVYSVVLSGIGVIGMSVTFPAVYVYGGEMFPTVVRNNGLGICSVIARAGSMIAPFISSMDGILPPLIFGIIPLLSTCMIYFMPETKGWQLLTTLEEVEEYGSSKSHRKGMENEGFDAT